MSAQSLCVQIQQQVGIETILHYTCRDRNVLSIQSDLLGASSIGLKNILCLTGDPPKMGNYPDATAVFDVDAIGLVNIVRESEPRAGYRQEFDWRVRRDLRSRWRRTRGCRTSITRCGGLRTRWRRARSSAITQPVFDLRLLEEFLRRIEGFRIPVIAGIWPLTSLRNAEFMKNDLRVSMPDEIMARMAGADVAGGSAGGGCHDCAGDAGRGARRWCRACR